MKTSLILAACFIIAAPLAVRADGFIDLEAGAVFTGLNDVRIPGNYATRFSLTGVLHAPVTYSVRARAGYTIADRHTISALVAPMTITAEGRSSRDILFNKAYFPANLHLKSTFMFNSYRLTYRYDIVKNKTVEFGLGLTGKIRHAAITLETAGVRRQRPDLGFVALINTRLQWRFVDPVSLLVEADWLVAPQGRAEDIHVALQFHARDNVKVRLGYRILEGGAKNNAVYTFSLFHYAVAGVEVRF